jgi:hypothetical protein
LLDFVTKLIFKTQKNLLENTNKEATYRTAIHMKYSSKFFNSRIMQKNKFFSLTLSLTGVGPSGPALAYMQIPLKVQKVRYRQKLGIPQAGS